VVFEMVADIPGVHAAPFAIDIYDQWQAAKITTRRIGPALGFCPAVFLFCCSHPNLRDESSGGSNLAGPCECRTPFKLAV